MPGEAGFRRLVAGVPALSIITLETVERVYFEVLPSLFSCARLVILIDVLLKKQVDVEKAEGDT